jgi:hydrogenase nickel incorporation protein HypA/HybF
VHELGILMGAINTVENFAKKNGVTKIQTLVLQIGELSSMIPKYIEDCYPAAVEGTLLQETELKIEILPGNAICQNCNNVFNLIENKDICPRE